MHTVCDVGDKVTSTPKDSAYFVVTHFSPLLVEVKCIVGHLAAYMLKAYIKKMHFFD